VQNKTALGWMILNGNDSFLEIVLQAFDNLEEISDEDQWLKTILRENLDASEESTFLELPLEFQNHCYYVANIYGRKKSLGQLMRLMKIEAPLPTSYEITRGKTIINQSMNALQAEITIQLFLKDMRQKGLLMSRQEFDAMPTRYSRRKDDLVRIVGREFVQQKIEALGAKFVKVAKKILVVESENTTGKFQIHPLWKKPFSFESDDIACYVQEIENTRQYISFEEMVELFDVIEATGFSDLWPKNFRKTDDGIYFIDTEYKSFMCFDYDKLNYLSDMLLDPADKESFQQLIQEKKEARKVVVDQYETYDSLRCQSYTLDRKVPYVFSLHEL
jgi:hypothetical protein